jgi:putative methionine-R-sulfoxide reductase with GAF domain
MTVSVDRSEVFERERKLLAEALSAVPFDVATFAEHATDDAEGSGGLLWRARLVVCPDQTGLRWSQRWMPVLPQMMEWARGSKPWVGNLEVFANNPPSGMLETGENLAGVGDYLSLGIRSLLCHPFVEAGHLRDSLLLGARDIDVYNETHLVLVNSPQIREARETIRVALRERSKEFSRGLRELFAKGLEPEQLAWELAHAIAWEFEWDYVGVFRVEQAQQRFVLVAQCDLSADKGLRLAPGYLQPIDAGMLGNALKLRRALRVDDVIRNPQHGYIQIEDLRTQSALSYPVCVGGEIEWMLDCESTETFTFHGPDLEALSEIIGDLESVLQYWLVNRLNLALLNCIGESAVVVNADGSILHANQSARDLFGAHGDARRKISEFAADEAAKALLKEPRSVYNTAISLVGPTGSPRSLLATAILPADSYGRWIWLFADPSQQQFLAGLYYARAIVEQLADQARGPLMLASALAKKIDQLAHDESVRDKVSHYVRRISDSVKKADLTYERLAGALAGKEQTDLRDLLGRLRLGLEPELRRTTEIRLPSHSIAAWGTADELLPALTELLKLLVSRLDARGRLRVTCGGNADRAVIYLTATGVKDGEDPLSSRHHADPLAAIVAVAVDAAGGTAMDLSLRDAVWRILREGGALFDRGTQDGQMKVEISLRKVQAGGEQP